MNSRHSRLAEPAAFTERWPDVGIEHSFEPIYRLGRGGCLLRKKGEEQCAACFNKRLAGEGWLFHAHRTALVGIDLVQFR